MNGGPPGPTVSCIIPARDAEEFIGAAIESALAQTHAVLEVIVVDDGSTDRTSIIAAGFGDPVKVVHQAAGGAPSARNRGIQESRGEIVAFLDADDLWLPEKTEVQVAALAAGGCDAVVAGVDIRWDAGLEEEAEAFRASARTAGAAFAFQTLLAPKSVFQWAGLIEETARYTEALEWFARARDLGVTFAVVDHALVRVRRRAGSLSHSEGVLDSYLDLLRERVHRHRAQP